MVYEIILLRLFIIFVVLGGLVALYKAISSSESSKKDSKQKVKEEKELSIQDIDEQVNKLKELLKKAEDDYNKGIESAESKLQMYKDAIQNLNERKNKTKDL